MVPIKTFFWLIVALIASQAVAYPAIDGRFDPAEGYTTHTPVYLFTKDGTEFTHPASLWTYRNTDTGDLSVLFSQPLTLVDNTYGQNAVGWGKDNAPANKKHRFMDLLNSDYAQFVITDGVRNVVLDFSMDYLAPVERPMSDTTYESFIESGRDSEITTGSIDMILGHATSMEYNFNSLGYVLTEDSPQVDPAYNMPDDSPYSGWIFEVVYEFQVSGDAFAQNGFGDVTIPVIHNSPNKFVKDRDMFSQSTGVVPAPGAMGLTSLGLALIGWLRRHNFLT